MIGYEQQMQFAVAMAKTFSEATASAMEASSAFWGGAKTPAPGRSWYRAPTANPFDWQSWMPSNTQASAPWAGWNAAFTQPFNPMAAAGGQPWSALAAFAGTMAAMQPAQAFWTSMMPQAAPPQMAAWQAMMWPMAQFNALAAAVTAPLSYSSYRSIGGHAATQISYTEPSAPRRLDSRLH